MKNILSRMVLTRSFPFVFELLFFMVICFNLCFGVSVRSCNYLFGDLFLPIQIIDLCDAIKMHKIPPSVSLFRS
jgi:hypothetical protein